MIRPQVTTPAIARKPLLILGLVLIALNLRPSLASIGPVLSTIRHDLGLGGLAAGLLTAIPSICMGIFAFISGLTIRRLGLERAVLWSLGLIGAATLARLAGHNVTVLYASTIAVGIGIAIGQAMLPSVINKYFPDRAALMTGLYTAGFNAGAALAAGTTVPLQKLSASWTIALATWAVLALPAMLAWARATRDAPARNQPIRVGPGLARLRSPWRSGRGWFLGLFLAGSCSLYLSTLAWLAPRYHAAGLSPRNSGFLFACFTSAQIAGALIAPALAQRTADRRPWLALVLLLVIIGMLAIAVTPLSAPYLFATVIGLGIGGVFPLALTLPLDYASHPIAVGQLTAMALGIGYLLGSAGPLFLGEVSDLTGGYEAPFIALAGVALLMLIGAVLGLKPVAD